MGNSKDHKLTFNVSLSANDYEKLEKCGLPQKTIDNIETRRELTIMHEVIKHDGDNMFEKIDNTIKDWEEDEYCGNPAPVYQKYKIKHR